MSASTETSIAVGPYRLAVDRHYETKHHLWIAAVGADRVRCGFDPLGAETAGDIVAIAFEPVGTRVERGAAYGSLEAAKFVGPLVAPVGGTILAHNSEVIANPALLNADPLAHWLVEIALDSPLAGLGDLVTGAGPVREWFEAEMRRFKEKGMIAE